MLSVDRKAVGLKVIEPRHCLLIPSVDAVTVAENKTIVCVMSEYTSGLAGSLEPIMQHNDYMATRETLSFLKITFEYDISTIKWRITKE